MRKDPLCALDLIQTAAGDPGFDRAGAPEALRRCGEAVFGAETTASLAHEAETANSQNGPSFDQRIRLSAARSGYPWLDAGLLAVAYVASDDPIPGHRERAERSLRLLGAPSDLERIVSGEPDDVREKVEEFIRSIE